MIEQEIGRTLDGVLDVAESLVEAGQIQLTHGERMRLRDAVLVLGAWLGANWDHRPQSERPINAVRRIGA